MGQLHRAVTVGRVLQRWEAGAERRHGQREHAFDRGRIDGHADRAQAAVEQDLRKRSPERVTHDDRRVVELPDDRGVRIDDLLDVEIAVAEVSARRSSTSPSSPGQLLAMTLKPRSS